MKVLWDELTSNWLKVTVLQVLGFYEMRMMCWETKQMKFTISSIFLKYSSGTNQASSDCQKGDWELKRRSARGTSAWRTRTWTWRPPWTCVSGFLGSKAAHSGSGLSQRGDSVSDWAGGGTLASGWDRIGGRRSSLIWRTVYEGDWVSISTSVDTAEVLSRGNRWMG